MAVGEYIISQVQAGVTWSQAKDLATSAGGQLASLSSSDENNVILAALASTNAFWVTRSNGEQFGPWIGLEQAPGSSEPGGGWYWLDGSAFSPFGWQSNQPDNYAGDNVGSFYSYQGSTGWEDHVDDPTTIGYPAINSYVTEFAASQATLTGTAGIDYIIGGTGNNTLNGAGGADTLVGGTGNDTYVVDNTGVTVVENAGGGNDTVLTDLSSYTLDANVEKLTYTGTGNFAGTGNTLRNVLTGGSGNDTLNGGLGADTMIGGAGNDTYVVNTAADVITEDSGAGTDLVRSSVSYALGANLENLTLIGTSAIDGTGNALNNRIVGNGGANVIDGGVGTDTLTGGGGNDTFVFQQGEAQGDTVTDFTGAGSAVGDELQFEGYGAGTIRQLGTSASYRITPDAAHGGSAAAETIHLTGVTNLDVQQGAGHNDVVFV